MQGARHEWHYRDEQGLENCIHGVAIDLLTRSSEEFIVIEKDDHSTVTIRLDKIIRHP
jgi:transcriptional antiterminator Rof (Rho-off)